MFVALAVFAALRARRLSRTQEKALASAARRMSPRVRKSRGMHPQLRGAAIWIALWLIYMMRASGDLSQPALMPHEEEMLRTQVRPSHLLEVVVQMNQVVELTVFSIHVGL